MYSSVITGKEKYSKNWNCIISIFLTSFIIYFVFGYAYEEAGRRGGKGKQFPGVEKFQQCHKQVLSSIQYSCFGKT